MITAKEVFQDIKSYAIEVWKKKYVILSVTLLATALYTFSSMTQSQEYVVEKTCMERDDSESGGGISGVLGQFRFGASGVSDHNYQKIERIGWSNLIIDRTMADSAKLDVKNDPIPKRHKQVKI
jgi:hypothetical protein